MDGQPLVAAWGATLSILLGLNALRGWRLDPPPLSVSAICDQIAFLVTMAKIPATRAFPRPTIIAAIVGADIAREKGEFRGFRHELQRRSSRSGILTCT